MRERSRVPNGIRSWSILQPGQTSAIGREDGIEEDTFDQTASDHEREAPQERLLGQPEGG